MQLYDIDDQNLTYHMHVYMNAATISRIMNATMTIIMNTTILRMTIIMNATKMQMTMCIRIM